jgi:hypothetical protein
LPAVVVPIDSANFLPAPDNQFSAELKDAAGQPAPPNIISASQIFTIECKWTYGGGMAGFLAATNMWRLQAAFEALGPGAEVELPAAPISDPYVPPPFAGVPASSYTRTLTFPPGTVSLATATRVAFHVVVLLTLDNNAAVPVQLPVAAAADLGVVLIFK